MRSLGWLAAVLLTACGSANLVTSHELFFGDLEPGEQRDVALLLVNSGEGPLPLTFESSSSEFTPLERSRTLGAGESGRLLIRFSPADLGPRTGELIIASSLGRSRIVLSGRGTGPRLAAPERVLLPPAALVAGQPTSLTATLTLSNRGTLGSRLVLQSPRVDAAELCVGTFVGSVCQPWSAPAALAPEIRLEVPLSLRATAPGPRHFTVELASNDVLHPVVTVGVDVLVEPFEPCVFSAPPEVVLTGASKELRVTHAGPGTCRVERATLTSMPAASLDLSAPTFPLRLESHASFSLSLRPNLLRPGARSGLVRVEAAGTTPLEVPVRWEPEVARCLAIVPSTIDFGVVKKGCPSPLRSVQLYNTCATPLTFSSVELASAAGEAPGGPNCPGSLPCPEFVVVSAPASGAVLQPGASTPVNLMVKYRPINEGPDTGALLVHTPGELEPVAVALQGRGDPAAHQVEVFSQPRRPLLDFLVMVDVSPSFVPHRPAVRANLSTYLTGRRYQCEDVRVGFAAADVSPDAGVELVANDAGQRWTSILEPDFVGRALSAFDSLPIGSEEEGCIGPAAAVMQDAGVRDGGLLAGLCITDALEQTPNPTAALQSLRGALSPGWFSWSAVTGVASSACVIEAADDGTHAALVAAATGVHTDLCGADWGGGLLPIGLNDCGYRTMFFLSARSAGSFDVRIDGQPVPAADWTYDPANNAILFMADRAPLPGQTLVIEYDSVCIP